MPSSPPPTDPPGSAVPPSLQLVRQERTVPAIVAELPAALAEVRAQGTTRHQQRRLRAALAGLVFSYWAHKFHHQRAILDPKRDKLIQQRLLECEDNVSDLLWALDMAAKDDWVTGEDPKSRHPNDSIEYLFRDRGMVEKFGDRSRRFRENAIHPMAAKYVPDA